VTAVLAADDRRRQLIGQVESLRQKINRHSKLIKQAIQKGQTADLELIAQGKQIKLQLKDLEPQLRELDSQLHELLLTVPNVPAADVPIGQDETANQVVRTEGQKPSFSFTPQPHQILMENLDLLDTKRAVKIGGFRSYFLKNQAVLLEQALMRYALDLLVNQGFTLMTVPSLVDSPAMWGTGYFPWGKEDHYRTQDGQSLIGTSEVSLTAYYKDEVLNEKDLPVRMVGISPCYRREVGSYGKDNQGIFRVHQFNKVEQVVYTIANEEETRKMHDTMLAHTEKLLQALDLPYHVLLMCTGDMGAGQRRKYDVEVWFPSQKGYRETHSDSYFNDFQSRRLNIRYKATDGTIKFVYTLNNTVIATPRILGAILENYQQKDGSVKIPGALQGYMGKEKIERPA